MQLKSDRILSIDALRGFDMFWIIGMNAITIYVLKEVFDFKYIADIFVQGFIHSLSNIQVPFYLACILIVKWLFLYFLYRQKIFLKA